MRQRQQFCFYTIMVQQQTPQ